MKIIDIIEMMCVVDRYILIETVLLLFQAVTMDYGRHTDIHTLFADCFATYKCVHLGLIL